MEQNNYNEKLRNKMADEKIEVFIDQTLDEEHKNSESVFGLEPISSKRSYKGSNWYHLTIFSGTLLACANGSFIALIPIHNVLKQPDYWYEDLLCRVFTVGFLFACQILIEAEYWSNFSFKSKRTTYVLVIILTYCLFIGISISYHYFWSLYLGYSHPSAFGQFVAAIAIIIISFAMLFRITLDQSNIKTRYAWFLGRYFVIFFAIWSYQIFGFAFVNFPTDYQWILAFFTPFARYIFANLLQKVIKKAAGEGCPKEKWIQFLLIHYVTTRHTIFLAVIVGGVSTPETSYCIVAIDFVKVIQSGWKIIQKYKHGHNVEGISICIFCLLELSSL